MDAWVVVGAAVAALGGLSVGLELSRPAESAYGASDDYPDTETRLENNESTIRSLARWRPVRFAARRRDSSIRSLLDKHGNPDGVNPAQYVAMELLYGVAFALGAAVSSLVVAFLIFGGVTGVGPLAIAAVAVLGSIPAGGWYVRRRTEKRTVRASKIVDKTLYELIELVATFMGDANLPPREAFLRTARYLTVPELVEQVSYVAADVNSGVSFEDSLWNFRRRVPTENVMSFCGKLIAATREGSIQVSEFVKDAETQREAAVLEIKERAQTTQIVSVLVIMFGFMVSALAAFGYPMVAAMLSEGGGV